MCFFFNGVLHRDWSLDIHYQRAPQRVPVTLSAGEVTRLLAAVPGLRERAAMEVAYAAGLRLSEVLHLKLSDIDSERMILRVDQGKGKKDRNVMLSPALLETLRAYWRESKPRVWLFPGQGGKRPLHATLLQRAFKQARHEGASPSRSVFTPCATALPRIFWNLVSTCARSRLCLAIAAWVRHSATCTWRATTYGRRGARWTP